MEKVEMVRHEWIIRLGSFVIPISAIKTFIEIVLLFAIAGFAYNVGQNDAQEGAKFASYLCEKGYYDSAADKYVKCYPVPEGIKIVWKCDFKNETKALPFFLNFTANDSLIR